MKIQLSLILGLGVISATAFAAEIPGSSFREGAWTGSAYDDEHGIFTHCAAAAPYKSGIILLLSLNRDGQTWGIGLTDPSWKLQEDQKYHIKVAIDHSWLTEADAQAFLDSAVVAYTSNRSF